MAFAAGDWRLNILSETGQTRQVDLAAEEVVIGRSEQADVSLDLPTVSRRHAKLCWTDNGQWELVDLGSRAGTYVNQQRIDRVAVSPGDVIGISRFSIRLQQRGSGRSAARAGATLASDAADDADISVLTRMAPPRLDTSHIAAMHELGKELITIEDPQERLERLCKLIAGDVIRARWVMALRLDAKDPSHPLEQLAAWPGDVLQTGDLHISRSTILAMQENHAPVLASNFKEEKGMVEMSVVTRNPATAVVACPLSEDEDDHSLIYVNLPPMYGSSEWLALIALAVKQYQQAEAAAAVREAARTRAAIERDLANARSIQLSLLPQRETLERLGAAYSFHPCDSVGGDLLDVVPMGDGRVLMMIADVTGHGLPAALATLSIHSIVHTSVRTDIAPVEMMRILNEHLCDYLPDGRFVTMACAIVDPRTGELECINAGHHAPVIFRSDGSSRQLQEATHLPLGLDRFDFAAETSTLAADELLLLVTDGLTELHLPDGSELGMAGVTEILATHVASGEPSLGELVRGLEAEMQAVRDQPAQRDDETFLICRRPAAG